MADNVSFQNETMTLPSGDWVEDAWIYPVTSTSQAAILFGKGSLLFVVILLTIVGNLLVLLAVCLEVSLRSPTNCFIVNLALADLLLGVSVLPFSATLELLGKKWFFGEIFCSIWAATDVLCCSASIISLCVISVDRYIGVSRPLTYSSIVTEKRASAVCVLVWFVSFAVSVGPLLGWKDPKQAQNPYTCEVTKQPAYVLFSVLVSFYVPTIIILSVYFKIYKTAVRQTKFLETGIKTIKACGANSDQEELTLRVHAGGQAVPSGGRLLPNATNAHLLPSGLQGRIIKFKRQKKAAKTLGIVVGVFIVCWFPFFFILPLDTLCISCSVPPLLFDICFWTGYCNSFLNPIIYACSSREFKSAFRNLLRCGRKPSKKKKKQLPQNSTLPPHSSRNKKGQLPVSDITILAEDCNCRIGRKKIPF